MLCLQLWRDEVVWEMVFDLSTLKWCRLISSEMVFYLLVNLNKWKLWYLNTFELITTRAVYDGIFKFIFFTILTAQSSLMIPKCIWSSSYFCSENDFDSKPKRNNKLNAEGYLHQINFSIPLFSYSKVKKNTNKHPTGLVNARFIPRCTTSISYNTLAKSFFRITLTSSQSMGSWPGSAALGSVSCLVTAAMYDEGCRDGRAQDRLQNLRSLP